MTEASHTPGPWAVRNAGTVIPEVHFAGGRIAAIDMDVETIDLRTVQDANARLIAAAPALLEACEMAYKFASAEWSDDHVALKKMLDAIAQARGAR